MFIGAAGRPARDRQTLASVDFPEQAEAVHWLGEAPARAALRPWGVATLDAEERWAEDRATGSWLALSGHLYHDFERAEDVAPGRAASRLLSRLQSHGGSGILSFEGTFAVAWYDAPARRLRLYRDLFGMEPLFYAPVSGGVLFGSRVRDMLRTGLLPGGLCPQGLSEFLTYCYVPGDATLDRGVRQVPPASALHIDVESGAMEAERYYRVNFEGSGRVDEVEFGHRYRELLEKAVLRRAGVERLGAFVSGGMDSSSIVTYVRQHREESIKSFSYRCAGKSFDESVYARALAGEMYTEHTEKEFGEQDTLRIDAAVAHMEVPFCDVGLELGTWLLGTAVEKQVDVILTGDGGDEMWASHPVYAAQKLVSWYDRAPVPGFVHNALLRLAATVPDSDKKRDIRVKLKRILPPAGLPEAIGPFRWRAYYAPAEMSGMLTPEYAQALESADPFAPIVRAHEGYQGPQDGLSPYLYNDYTTLTPSYFYRLGMLRNFGVEVRTPFYDRELVDFVARVPAAQKLEGIERTKRLFRASMEGVLPDVINHRKDKLGHSIPFKNWLREGASLKDRVAEVCSEASVRERGIFQPEAVASLLKEHQTRRHNRSHRIWAIHVLELWLRAREAQL